MGWQSRCTHDSLTEVGNLLLHSLLMEVAGPKREMVTGCILADRTKSNFETRCLCSRCGPQQRSTGSEGCVRTRTAHFLAEMVK